MCDLLESYWDRGYEGNGCYTICKSFGFKSFLNSFVISKEESNLDLVQDGHGLVVLSHF